MNGQELFKKELCGISSAEVAGLLSLVRRKENPYTVTTNDSKRIRQWKCALLGIPITVREINMHYESPHVKRARYSTLPYYTVEQRFDWAVEIFVETIEWEFSVWMRSARSSDERDIRPSGLGKVGNHNMFFYEPWFEGDSDTYRSNMSLIRLMDLKDTTDPDNVVVF